MNKLLTLGLAGLLSAGLVSAEETTVDTEAVAEETAVSNFDGMYLGLGIGGSFLKNKDAKDPWTRSYTTQAKAAADNDNAALITLKDNYKSNRFSGDVFVGYRKVFANNFALGVEAMIDFAKNQKRDFEWSNGNKKAYHKVVDKDAAANAGFTAGNTVRMTGRVENKAVTPELALTAGYAAQCAYFGLRVAAARPEAKVSGTLMHATDESDTAGGQGTKAFETKVTKVVPAVYLEAARAFGKWIVNVQAGYQFAQKKEFAGGTAKAKFNQGWKIRAGVARSFNLF